MRDAARIEVDTGLRLEHALASSVESPGLEHRSSFHGPPEPQRFSLTPKRMLPGHRVHWLFEARRRTRRCWTPSPWRARRSCSRLHLVERLERPPVRGRGLHQGAGRRAGGAASSMGGSFGFSRERRGEDEVRRRPALRLPSGRSLAAAMGLAGPRSPEALDRGRARRLRRRHQPRRRLCAVSWGGRGWHDVHADRGPRPARAAAAVRGLLELCRARELDPACLQPRGGVRSSSRSTDRRPASRRWRWGASWVGGSCNTTCSTPMAMAGERIWIEAAYFIPNARSAARSSARRGAEWTCG